MIRVFSKCGSNRERIQFLEENGINCSFEDLVAICQVMSFNFGKEVSREDLLNNMIAALKQRAREEGMGIHRISRQLDELDPIPEKVEVSDGNPLKPLVDTLFLSGKI